MDKLDPVLKDKWTEALKSRSYVQGKGYLHRDGSYCCLGVLAVLAGHSIEDLGTRGWLGAIDRDLSDSLVGHDGSNITHRLEEMNDGTGCRVHSFTEIAEWIETNL